MTSGSQGEPRRSSRPDVRNPILVLPTFQALTSLDPPVRAALATLLKDLRRDARKRATRSWNSHKAFAAAYWSTVAVYAGHIARALTSGSRTAALSSATTILPHDGPAGIDEGRYCVLSTAHLTARTAGLLDEWASWPPGNRPIDIAASVYGWFVPAREIDEARQQQIPPDLLQIVSFARERGFQFALLHCDADEVEALAHRHW